MNPYDEPGPAHSEDWLQQLGWQDQIKKEAFAHRLTREQMEARRLEAAQLLQAGQSQASVARFAGVSRVTANRWARVLQCGQSLERRRTPGRPPKLTPDQKATLTLIWLQGPQAYGFKKWTTRTFAESIWQRLHVRYDPDHVGKLILAAGLRPKREKKPPC